MKPDLIYIADPMCSWCWGFAPVVQHLREAFDGRADFHLLLGGLRPGPHAVPLDDAFRGELRHHWEQVAAASGQPFTFDFLSREEDFLYDTDPPSRATVAVRRHGQPAAFDFLHSLQAAFYWNNRDITDPNILAELIANVVGEQDMIPPSLNDEKLARETEEDYRAARRLGCRGFPSLALRHGGLTRLVLVGYADQDTAHATVDAELARLA